MHVYANTLMLKLRRTRTCVFCYVAYRRPMSLSYNAEAHGAFPFWDNTGTSTRRSPRSARATVHTSAWVRMRAEMHTLVNHHIAMSMCAEATLTSFFPVRFMFPTISFECAHCVQLDHCWFALVAAALSRPRLHLLQPCHRYCRQALCQVRRQLEL